MCSDNVYLAPIYYKKAKMLLKLIKKKKLLTLCCYLYLHKPILSPDKSNFY